MGNRPHAEQHDSANAMDTMGKPRSGRVRTSRRCHMTCIGLFCACLVSAHFGFADRELSPGQNYYQIAQPQTRHQAAVKDMQNAFDTL